jgi:hypothetical protein
LDDRGPVTIQLKDANTNKDILTVIYSVQELRMKSNGQDIQIRQSLGGPFIMAKFEIAENNLMSLNAEIRRLSNEIDHDVQIMRQVIMFIDQLSSPFGFLKKAAHNVE